MSEKIMTVRMKDGKIIYTGSAERSIAERDGLRHLTVIAAPIITDGNNRGKLLVHNRRDKQLAKGKPCPAYSYNLFGGHCNPPENDTRLIGTPVSEALLLENLLRELSEEMYFPCEGDEKATALENKTEGSVVYAKSFPVQIENLIPLGYTVYSSPHDNEYSFVYVLPITSETADNIIAADDYQKADSTKGSLALPTALMTLDELHSLYETDSADVEICNAITRLWDEQNAVTLHALTDYLSE